MVRKDYILNIYDEVWVDNFAGGGGASTGYERASGRHVDFAVNHDKRALGMHRINHPQTVHIPTDVFDVDPMKMTGGRPIGGSWFSPDCTHFSKARGGVPVSARIRGLVFIMIRYAQCRTRVMYMENVEEIVTLGPLIELVKKGVKGMYPDPEHEGRTWEALLSILTVGINANHPDIPYILEMLNNCVKKEELVHGFGYKLECKQIRSYVYGSPTIRKRLYMIARCDGLPIIWPEQTHFNPKDLKGRSGGKPWRTIAECIDWDVPCNSIFLSREEAKRLKVNCRRPLADSTLRRIAVGVDRYVLKAKKPFLVNLTHQGNDANRVEPIDEPVNTITGANRGEKAIVAPIISECANSTNARSMPADEPSRTACSNIKGGHFNLVASELVHTAHGEQDRQGNQRRGRGSKEMTEPMPSIVGSPDGALLSASLAREFGESIGQPADEPGPTVMATGQGKTSLLTAALATNTTGHPGAPADSPCPTIMADGQHQMLLAANMVQRGHKQTNSKMSKGCDEPCRTQTGAAEHCVIAANLTKFNTGSVGQPANEPIKTIVAGTHEEDTHGGAASTHGLVATSLAKFHGDHEGRQDGATRGQEADKPLATQDTSNRHALLATSLVKMRGGVDSHEQSPPVTEPAHTISADGTHHGLSTAYLAQANDGFNTNPGHPVDEPVSSITGTGSQQQIVTGQIAAYYGTEEDGQALNEPARTTTGKARFGLSLNEAVAPPMREDQIEGARRVAAFLRSHGVEFEGEFAMVGPFVIVDIAMRMLTPRELFRAQGFYDDYIIDKAWVIDPATGAMEEVWLTKEQQIKMCGNSVSPDVADALIAANSPEMCAWGKGERKRYKRKQERMMAA